MVDVKEMLKELSSLGEEKLNKLLQDALSNEKIATAMMKVLQTTQSAREKLSKNVQVALELVNVATKEDYEELKAEIRKLAEKVEELEKKIDDLAKATKKSTKTTSSKKSTKSTTKKTTKK